MAKSFYYRCRVYGCRHRARNEYDLCRWHWANVNTDLQQQYVNEFKNGIDRAEFRAVAARCFQAAQEKPVRMPERAHLQRGPQLPMEGKH